MIIQVEGLVKEFKVPKKESVKAINEISFSVNQGEIFGLIGDNGAGKTTTLRVMSTLIAPSQGKVEVCGLDVVKNSTEVRCSIGFLSGTTGLYGRLNAREILRYFGSLYGLTGNTLKSRINELVDQFGLEEFLNRPCDQLSTGQKQRVNLARAIIHKPPLLFLDEPTSGLDVQASQGVLEFIEHSRSEGVTIVFCSHIMTEVERLCDRVVILHAGKIMGRGSIAEIKAQTGESTMERAFLNLVGYTRKEQIA